MKSFVQLLKEEGVALAAPAISRAETTRVVNEYREKFPSLHSFDKRDDDFEICLEQRLHEFELEKALFQTQSLLETRQKGFLRVSSGENEPLEEGNAKLPILPVSEKPKEFNEYREERERKLASELTLPSLPPLLVEADFLRDEVERGAESLSEDNRFVIEYFEFLAKRKQELLNKQMVLTERWDAYVREAAVSDGIKAQFIDRIVSLQQECDFVDTRMKRLISGEMPIKGPLSFAHAPLLARKKNAISNSDALYMLRCEVTRANLNKRLSHFYARLKWLPYTDRHSLARSSRAVFSKLTGSSAAAQNSCPLMIHSHEQLETALEELRLYYNIATTLSAEDGQEFYYFVNRKFKTIFNYQVAISNFTSYSSDNTPDLNRTQRPGTQQDGSDPAVVSANTALNATTPSSSVPIRTLSEDHTPDTQGFGSKAFGLQHEVVVECGEWADNAALQGTPSVEQRRQSVRLARTRKFDDALQVECGFLCSQDLGYVVKRMKELVEDHNTRTFSSAEGASPLRESAKPGSRPNPEQSGPLLAPHKVLAYYYLRHARARDFRRTILSNLNYFRSLQKNLLADPTTTAAATATVPTPVESSDTLSSPPQRAGGDSSPSPTQGHDPGEKEETTQATHDHYRLENGMVVVLDPTGQPLMYSAALSDLTDMDDQLLKIGSIFLTKPTANASTVAGETGGVVIDRMAVAADLYESEAWFSNAKRNLLAVCHAILSHTVDSSLRSELAQFMIDVIARRPRIEFSQNYFTNSYAMEIVILDLLTSLLREMAAGVVADSRHFSAHMDPVRSARLKEDRTGQLAYGLADPQYTDAKVPPMASLTDLFPIQLMEIHPELGRLARVPGLLRYLLTAVKEATLLLRQAPAFMVPTVPHHPQGQGQGQGQNSARSNASSSQGGSLPTADQQREAGVGASFNMNLLEMAAVERVVLQFVLGEWRKQAAFPPGLPAEMSTAITSAIESECVLEDPNTMEMLVQEITEERTGPSADFGMNRGSRRSSTAGRGPLGQFGVRRMSVVGTDVTPSGRRASIVSGSGTPMPLAAASNVRYQPSVDAVVKVLDLLRYREQLLLALHESHHLTFVYQRQAKAMGNELGAHAGGGASSYPSTPDLRMSMGGSATASSSSLIPRAVEVHGGTNILADDSGRGGKSRPELFNTRLELGALAGVNPSGVQFAVCEFDATLGIFDLNSVNGVRATLSAEGLARLRLTTQVQIAHKNALIVATKYNQCALDTVSGDHLDALAGTPLGPQALVARLQKYFLSIAAHKTPLRATLLTRYTDALSTLQANTVTAPGTVSPTLRLKLDLISVYLSDLMTNLRSYALKTQICDVVGRTRALLHIYPKGEEVLRMGLDPDDPCRQAESTLQKQQHPHTTTRATAATTTTANGSGSSSSASGEGGGGGEEKSGSDSLANLGESGGGGGGGGEKAGADDLLEEEWVVSSDGAVGDVWQSPHTRTILKVFSKDEPFERVRPLLVSLRLFQLLHDVLLLIRALARLTQPLADVITPYDLRVDSVPMEISRIKNELRNLNSAALAEAVIMHLCARRTVLFYKLLLGLRMASEAFFNRRNLRAHLATTQAWDRLSCFAYIANTTNSSKPPLSVNDFAHVVYDSLSPRPLPLDALVGLSDPGSQSVSTGGGNATGPPPAAGLTPADDEATLALHARGILDRFGPFVGANPMLSLSGGLLREAECLLLELEESERQYANGEIIALELVMDETLSQRSVYGTAQPSEAASLQIDVLSTSLALHHLKAVFLKTVLGTNSLIALDPGVLTSTYESLILSRVMPTVEEKKKRSLAAGKEEEKLTGALNALDIDGAGPGEEQLLGGGELGHRKRLLLALKQQLDRAYIGVQLCHVRAINHTMAAEIQGQSARFNLAEISDRVTDPTNYSAKQGFLGQFLDVLLFYSTPGHTEDGERTITLSEQRLGLCLDQLARHLSTFFNDSLRQTHTTTQALLGTLGEELKAMQRQVQHLNRLMQAEARDRLHHIHAQVGDKGYELIIEISSLYRQLVQLNEDRTLHDQQVRESVRREYDDLVKDLSLKLVSVRSQFAQYRSTLYRSILASLHDVRQEAFVQMLNIGSTPTGLKRDTRRLVRREEEVARLELEISSLKEQILDLESSHVVKLTDAQAHYERKLMISDEEKATVNQTLWQLREEHDLRETVLREHLQTTQRALAAAEGECSALRKELTHQQKNKNALVQWKVSQSKILNQLESRVEQYERWSRSGALGPGDSGRMKRKAMTESQAQFLEMRSVPPPVDVSAKDKEIARLTKELEKERRLKMQAFDRLDRYKDEHTHPDAEGSGAADVQMQLISAENEIDALSSENIHYRKILSSMGIDPGDVSQTLRSTPNLSQSTVGPLRAKSATRSTGRLPQIPIRPVSQPAQTRTYE